MRPGRHAPLGATYDGQGVNFAVYSENAQGMELCLFDDHGEKRIPLREHTMHIWHGYVAGLKPGQRYGFRAKGAYEPNRGLLFNPNKLLVDPYARCIEGKIDYGEPVFAFGDNGAADTRDDAKGIPKGVVCEDRFDWEGDAHPYVPWADTVLYEAHVKGLTMTHPEVPAKLRGTYLGLATDPILHHLKTLGVTSIELLPIHECMNEHSVAARGRVNYWGYSTLGFFAPDQRFASEPGRQVHEFKQMVKRLHSAGIEVVLDVVYNHTGEGDHLGPTVSLRGLDNPTYYRLHPQNRARYEDYTGCGNSLNMMHPQTIKLVMDSLRYWVTEMHVDGFRFDLATTLAREVGTSVDRLSAFFDIIHQDPVLSNVKLIAEPWDLGQNGYQVGNFPVLWTEWNGRYRDTIRKFWTGNRSVVGDMGYRLTGSSDLYEDDGRRPHASINFITAHDGFTLRDLVTYEKKRNLANGEENRDGWDDNNAWNCGVEGPSDDAAIIKLRARQIRNFIVTLMLSQGVPMLTAGDEIGKTQGGNNNAYAQDNEISWLDWKLDVERERLFAYVSEVVAFRRRHPVFRRPRFFRGERVAGSDLPDIAWFRVDGREMQGSDWNQPERAVIGLLLSGEALDWRDAKGDNVLDDTFLILLNGSHDDVTFTFPSAEWGQKWACRIDTSQDIMSDGATLEAGARLSMPSHSLVVFKRTEPVRGTWRPTRSTKGGF
jgi:glycogen operon protein